MDNCKSSTDFIIIKALKEEDSSAQFHTSINKVTKKPTAEYDPQDLPQKYKNIWFEKTDDDEGDALREVLAQEMFRLLIPNHPKTRLVRAENGKLECVVSKEVPGFNCLEDLSRHAINKNIKSGKYYGLGEVMLVALLVNETDLKKGNVCLNDKNQFIKIDGDCCFSKLGGYYKDKNQNITASDIQNLPLIKDYHANHWLDWLKYGDNTDEHIILDREISALPHFRAEVNRAMLKALILPDKLMHDFVSSYAPTVKETNIHVSEIMKRCAQLKRAALKDDSFCEYMQTVDAEHDMKNFLRYLKEFKTTGKHHLEMNAGERLVREQFEELKKKIKNNSLKTQERKFQV